MSTALVKANQTKIEVIDLGTIATPDSALAMACEGQLALADIDEAYLADEETETDLAGIYAQVPRLSANGQAGCFCPPGTDKAEHRKMPDAIEGIILARREGAIHYTPQEAKADDAKAAGYVHLLLAPKWICRNPNVAEPDKAIINPQLTAAQLTEARQLGIGGATGKGCLGCSAGCWRKREDGTNVRLCSQSEALVWTDKADQEPRVLQVNAGNSVAALKKFFGSVFRRQNKPMSLFSYVLRFSWASEKHNGKDVLVLVPTVLGAVPIDAIPFLRQARAACMWMLDRAAAAQTLDAPPEEETPTPAAPPPTDDAAAQACLDGLV